MRVSGHKLEWDGGSLIRLSEPGVTFGPEFFPDPRGHEIPAEIALTVQPFLLSLDGQAPILIDAGYGVARGAEVSHVVANLARNGVGEAEIGQVFFTHLHGDHCLGLPPGAFPNAKISLTEDEIRFWQGKDHPGGRLVAEESHRLNAVQDGDEIAPGIRVVAMPGHTPGHAGLIINDKIALIGDVVHFAPLQIMDMDLVPKFDADPVMAVETRKRVLGMIADQDLIFCGAHFTSVTPYFRLATGPLGFTLVDA